MSNFVRLRWPRLFLLLQGVAAIEDATSTFGPGNNNLVSVGTSLMALLGFLWQPGKSLEQLDPGPENRPDHVSAAMEFIARVAVIVLGALDKDDDIKVIKDVLSGWDAPGLDLDSTTPPLRSDIISNRMSSFSFGGDSQLPATQPATLGRVNVTTSMIHAAEGGPALFLALGGNAQIQQPLGKTWTFNVKSEMDAAVAIAISFDRFDIKGPSTGNFQFSVGYAANPRKPSPEEPAPPPIAFSFPSSIGCRIDFGHLDFSLSLSSQAAEALVTMTDSALVLDGHNYDGFISHLLTEYALQTRVQRHRRLFVGARAGPRGERGWQRRSGAAACRFGKRRHADHRGDDSNRSRPRPAHDSRSRRSSPAWSRGCAAGADAADHARAQYIVQRADRAGLHQARSTRHRVHARPGQAARTAESPTDRPASRPDIPAWNSGARRDAGLSQAADRFCTTRIRASTSARSTSHSAAD